MLNHQACEDLIALVRKFAVETQEAEKVYRDLPAVIDRETEVIRSRDVKALQAVVRQKLRVGQDLEVAVSRMMETAIKAVALLDDYGVEHEKFELNVTRALMIFEQAITAIASVDEFKANVFDKVLNEAKDAGQTFLKSVQSTTDKIEVNKLVTTELLKAYQDSIRFWQDVALEYESTYTPDGKRKADPNHGVIKVGA